MNTYEYLKEWRKRNPGCRSKEYQARKAKNPEKIRLSALKGQKVYMQKHRERLLPLYAKQAHERRKRDPEGQKRRVEAFRTRHRAKQEAIAGRPRPDFCELCGQAGDGVGCKKRSGIVFDHCHVSGLFRGWLCDRCNKVLGLVKDDIVLLAKLVSYLERSNVKTDS